MIGRHCPRFLVDLVAESVRERVGAVYEYKTVKLLGGLTKSAERDWPGILNAEAAKGWRLVTVDQSIAFFERRNG